MSLFVSFSLSLCVISSTTVGQPATHAARTGSRRIDSAPGPAHRGLGLPVEGIGILVALDTLPDMFKTLLNVTADMLVAVMTVPKGALPASNVPEASS
jgi:L-cystine uptake protein TcyP (sodium:dicarboxylate symporter family)